MVLRRSNCKGNTKIPTTQFIEAEFTRGVISVRLLIINRHMAQGKKHKVIVMGDIY